MIRIPEYLSLDDLIALASRNDLTKDHTLEGNTTQEFIGTMAESVYDLLVEIANPRENANRPRFKDPTSNVERLPRQIVTADSYNNTYLCLF